MDRVLHTKSDYAIDLIKPNFTIRSQFAESAALSNLVNQEYKLYNAFDATNYEQFKAKIKHLFSEQNISVLERFEANHLASKIKPATASMQYPFNVDVEFQIDISKLNSAQFRLDMLIPESKDIKITQEGNKALLYFNFNVANVKTVLNSIYKGRRFRDINNMSFGAAELLLRQLISSNIVEINSKNPSTGKYVTVKETAYKITNFPWGCTREEFKIAQQSADAGDFTMLREFERAGLTIKDFVYNQLAAGASSELMAAIDKTWNELFGASTMRPELFFHGSRSSNFLNGVLGAFGEFQTAVIFNFVSDVIKDPSIREKFSSKLVGQQTNALGEQLKTDVKIMDFLGIQVKNYKTIKSHNESTKLLYDIDTGIHPQKFSEYLSLQLQSDFLDYIANYYFNTTYAARTSATFNSLLTMLNSYLGEIMNFNMSNAVEDTVCFYMIGGKYLVPASKILEAASELNIVNNLKIQSNYPGLSDEEYNEADKFHTHYVGKKGGISMHQAARWVEYWKEKRGQWMKRQPNMDVYDFLISRGITIRTKFNLFDEIEKYALY